MVVTVELRALTRKDFPTLSAWLREPQIAWWWHDDPATDALEQQYGPSIDGVDPTAVLLAEVDGVPAGLIQWYRWADEPAFLAEVALACAVPSTAASLDYLVGSPELRGRGLGRAMITATLDRIWASGATSAVVPVHADNLASRAVLVRCGFTLVAEAELAPDNPALDRRHLIYRVDRPRSACLPALADEGNQP